MSANIENVKAQVIEELEQVIEKDKQVQADETDEEAGGGAVPEKEDLLSDALHTQGLVDEEGLRTRNQKCAGARRCMGTTWDVMRSVPLLTFVWAAGAIYASNMAVTNVEKVASQMQVFHYFKQIFRVMDWGLAYIDFVDAFVAVLAILFSGATLELFVGRFCKFDGCYRHFSRFSFRALQGLFFPAAYVGFLASMALLVSTVILASTVVMTNMACGIATTPEGTAAAASQLSSQISLVTHWFAIKSVAISPEDLASYCATTTLNTTWFWRMTFIYVTAAAICQVNLAVTMWTVYLTTGFEIRRGDLVRRHNTTLAKYQMERKRPASGDFGTKRPLSGDFNNGLRGNWTGGNEGKEDIEA